MGDYEKKKGRFKKSFTSSQFCVIFGVKYMEKGVIMAVLSVDDYVRSAAFFFQASMDEGVDFVQDVENVEVVFCDERHLVDVKVPMLRFTVRVEAGAPVLLICPMGVKTVSDDPVFDAVKKRVDTLDF